MSESIEREESLEEAVEQQGSKALSPDGEETVVADVVHIDQGGAQSVQAETVHVQSGGIGKAEAETIDVQQGGIGIAQGETITVHEGGIGIALAERAEVHNGGVLLLLAEEVSGETKVLFDLRAAVLFGLIVGAVGGLFKMLARRKGD
jgi:hypothetical protein